MHPEINSLDKLFFSVYNFTCEVTEEINLAEFKGSALRGGFGLSFKRLVCINKAEKECNRCVINKGCSYFKIWMPHIDNETSQRLVMTPDSAPRPFVLEPPLSAQRKYVVGERFDLKLILVGWSIDYLPYFIIVFEKLGMKYGLGKKNENQRGKFKLINVRCNNKEIYSGETKELKVLEDKLTIANFNSNFNSDRLTINFLTPTRLEKEHERLMLNKEDAFQTFAIRLYGRLLRLQEIYCSKTSENYNHKKVEELSQNIKLVESDLKWYQLDRPMRNNDTNNVKSDKDLMRYDGFVGTVKFHGDFSPFAGMIKLGEVLHIGKYYTFGLGKYEVINE